MNLILEKYVAIDYDIFKGLVMNDEVMKYISGNAWTEHQAREKFDVILATNNSEDGLGYFKLFNQEGDFVGYCKLERYKQDDSILEIGYVLKKEFWNMGIGSAICQVVLDRADKLFPAVDIIGIIDPENLASKKILEKFGFERSFLGIENDLPTEKLTLKKFHTI